MRKENIFLNSFVFLLFFVVVTADFSGALYYAIRFFHSDSHYLSDFILALICMTAFVSTASAFLMSRKKKNGSVCTGCMILSVVCNLPVLFCAAVWVLHFCGLELVPPPQR